MELSKYAPVIIPTLNRYDHLKRCLESLEKCTGAKLTDIYVGLDYPPSEKYREGWEKIDTYLREKELNNGFKTLIVRRRDHNCGVGKEGSNSMLLMQEVNTIYDCFIFTEDDNEFSPCFLDYINKALIKYWNDEHVRGVCGYSFPVEMKHYPYNVYFHHDNSAWGIAKWKHKKTILPMNFKEELLKSPSKLFKVYRKDSRLFYLFLSMMAKHTYWGDVMNGIYNILNNQLSLYPKVSMVRNYGHDGSGRNGGCDSDDKFSVQTIDERQSFEIDDIAIKDCDNKELQDYFRMRLIVKLSCLKQYFTSKFKCKK